MVIDAMADARQSLGRSAKENGRSLFSREMPVGDDDAHVPDADSNRPDHGHGQDQSRSERNVCSTDPHLIGLGFHQVPSIYV